MMVSQLLSYGEDSDRHDVYPKPDLNGNFLGYGFPLCDQTGSFLLTSFLFKGVAFELVRLVGAVAVELEFGSILVMAGGVLLYFVLVQGNRTTPGFASPNTLPNTRQSGIQRMMCLKPSGSSTESLLTRSCDPIASADMKLWTVKVLPSAGNKPEIQVCSCVERILSTSLEAC